jgi:uncharacterized membrane protein
MDFLKKKIQDEDLERIIGQLLRCGVIISSVIVTAGGIIYLYRHGAEPPRFSQFRGEPDKMKRLGPMWQSILGGEGRPLIMLGLCVLIATPIARIAFSIIGYLLEKDYLYLVITLSVLAVILWNF